jgi:hypothetical protein
LPWRALLPWLCQEPERIWTHMVFGIGQISRSGWRDCGNSLCKVTQRS